MMIHNEPILLAILAMLLVVAVWMDHRNNRIPNWLTGTTLAAGITGQSLANGFGGAGTALAGVLAGFAIFLLPYLKKSMAAGDVKLMAAVGAFVGPQLVLVAAAASMVAGASVGLLLLSVQARRGETPKASALLTTRFPYASAIAIGTAVALLLKEFPWMP